jgi:hypothetical protein
MVFALTLSIPAISALVTMSVTGRILMTEGGGRMSTPPEWVKPFKTQWMWKHKCVVRNELLVLTAENLGLYNHIQSWGKREWQVDPDPGCPWCHRFPPEAETILAKIRGREKK